MRLSSMELTFFTLSLAAAAAARCRRLAQRLLGLKMIQLLLLLLLDDHAALTRLLCLWVQVNDGLDIATDADANLIDLGLYIHICCCCSGCIDASLALTLALTVELLLSLLLSCRNETGTGNDGVVDDEIGRVR